MMNNKQVTLKEDSSIVETTEQPDIMQAIMSMAKDETFDAEKMKILVGMKNDHEDREAKRAYTSALVEFSRNPPRIIKNAKGHTNRYATIDSVNRQVKQPLWELGLVFTWEVDVTPDLVTVYGILSHQDGHSTRSKFASKPDTTGSKSAAQGQGAIITYGKRYTLLAALGLAEEGEDTDGIMVASKQGIDAEQIAQIETLIEETETELPSFCKAFNIGAIAEMSNSTFGVAVKQLNIKKGKM